VVIKDLLARLHKTLWWRMKRLMKLKTLKDAQKELIELITWFSEISIEAENSMREVGLELTTVHALLGVSGELRKSLYLTNPIESLIFGIRHRMGRVMNWKSSKEKDQPNRLTSADSNSNGLWDNVYQSITVKNV
jgi:hypothetical protein